MKISGIYKIQSKKKPKRFYIGSSYNIQRRWKDHIRYFERGTHHSKKFQQHFDKYGIEDLEFSVIIGCPKEELIEQEQFFLDALKPYFNVNPKAGSSKGRPPWNKGLHTGIVPPNVYKKGHIPHTKGKFGKDSPNYGKVKPKEYGEKRRRAWAKWRERKRVAIQITIE
jgi:group I intron endonuclease